MDTRQLRAFCAVVELKSFSQAAEPLGVTQPAVSLQVRSLEKRSTNESLGLGWGAATRGMLEPFSAARASPRNWFRPGPPLTTTR